MITNVFLPFVRVVCKLQVCRRNFSHSNKTGYLSLKKKKRNDRFLKRFLYIYIYKNATPFYPHTSGSCVLCYVVVPNSAGFKPPKPRAASVALDVVSRRRFRSIAASDWLPVHLPCQVTPSQPMERETATRRNGPYRLRAGRVV